MAEDACQVSPRAGPATVGLWTAKPSTFSHVWAEGTDGSPWK
ncbi:MAG TPA: hypothetical protein VKI00_20215 [Mycobacterium sp.]|nr:hypothetical protein [Mycobacterium sp.]HME77884.1 hypothetical protein [Mycobacterium sp.]